MFFLESFAVQSKRFGSEPDLRNSEEIIPSKTKVKNMKKKYKAPPPPPTQVCCIIIVNLFSLLIVINVKCKYIIICLFAFRHKGAPPPIHGMRLTPTTFMFRSLLRGNFDCSKLERKRRKLQNTTTTSSPMDTHTILKIQ